MFYALEKPAVFVLLVTSSAIDKKLEIDKKILEKISKLTEISKLNLKFTKIFELNSKFFEVFLSMVDELLRQANLKPAANADFYFVNRTEILPDNIVIMYSK